MSARFRLAGIPVGPGDASGPMSCRRCGRHRGSRCSLSGLGLGAREAYCINLPGKVTGTVATILVALTHRRSTLGGNTHTLSPSHGLGRFRVKLRSNLPTTGKLEGLGNSNKNLALRLAGFP